MEDPAPDPITLEAVVAKTSLDAVVEKTTRSLAVRVEEAAVRQLEENAVAALEEGSRDFLRRVLEEARKIASEETSNEFCPISVKHVDRGLLRAVESWASRLSRRHRTRDRLRELVLLALGAAFGLSVDHPKVALAVALLVAVVAMIRWEEI